ncbi:bacteriocin immunity protein [Aerococcaceae bacterium NML160702]|nr:bacteriocin immunity protein [Aerococcaceae bacterium NML160702]
MSQPINHSIHQLYNSLAHTDKVAYQDLLEVWLKVYQRLDNEANPEALVNRLVNYIYFTTLTEQLTFSSEQEAYIRELADFAKHAGLNGCYRSDYGDKDQF